MCSVESWVNTRGCGRILVKSVSGLIPDSLSNKGEMSPKGNAIFFLHLNYLKPVLVANLCQHEQFVSRVGFFHDRKSTESRCLILQSCKPLALQMSKEFFFLLEKRKLKLEQIAGNMAKTIKHIVLGQRSGVYLRDCWEDSKVWLGRPRGRSPNASMKKSNFILPWILLNLCNLETYGAIPRVNTKRIKTTLHGLGHPHRGRFPNETKWTYSCLNNWLKPLYSCRVCSSYHVWNWTVWWNLGSVWMICKSLHIISSLVSKATQSLGFPGLNTFRVCQQKRWIIFVLEYDRGGDQERKTGASHQGKM